MKKLTFTFILTITYCYSAAQSGTANPFADINQSMMEYDSYEALRILRSNKSAYLLGTGKQGLGMYSQAMATALTMNGSRADSTLWYEWVGTTGREPQPGMKLTDTVDLSVYNIVSAKDYIIDRAQDESIIMINESHVRPQHRLFLKSMLEELYNSGYRNLCLEALGYQPKPYEDFKTIIDKGYYTKEPCFAEMIREALRLGYKIYGYEATEDNYKISRNRDSLQAVNLRDIRSTIAEEKMLIFAGHAHISKSWEVSTYNHFKNLTGLTPLTVNQTRYGERPTQRYENVLYIALWNKFPNTRQVVVMDNMSDEDADIYTFPPRAGYINGRSDYLLENGRRKMKKIKVKTPSVVKAYYAHEYAKYGEECTPIDILVAEKKGEHYLSIPKRTEVKIITSPIN